MRDELLIKPVSDTDISGIAETIGAVVLDSMPQIGWYRLKLGPLLLVRTSRERPGGRPAVLQPAVQPPLSESQAPASDRWGCGSSPHQQVWRQEGEIEVFDLLGRRLCSFSLLGYDEASVLRHLRQNSGFSSGAKIVRLRTAHEVRTWRVVP